MKIIQTSPGGQYNEEFLIEKHFKDVDSVVDDRIKLTYADKNVINESYYNLCQYGIVIVNDNVNETISKSLRYIKIEKVIKDYKVKTRNDKINSILE